MFINPIESLSSVSSTPSLEFSISHKNPTTEQSDEIDKIKERFNSSPPSSFFYSSTTNQNSNNSLFAANLKTTKPSSTTIQQDQSDYWMSTANLNHNSIQRHYDQNFNVENLNDRKSETFPKNVFWKNYFHTAATLMHSQNQQNSINCIYLLLLFKITNEL